VDLAVIDRATIEVTQSMKLPGHTAAIHDAGFSRDGGWLATASADNTIRLWKWPTVTTVPTATIVLQGHTGEVRTIAISADGHWLVSGSEDGTARLWDLKASDPSAGSIVLPGHVGPVWKVLINDNGSVVETAGQDAQVHLWGSTAAADTNSLGKVACSTAGRSLTPDEWQTFIGGDYRQTCQDVFLKWS
jgi:WD40 repeat protein